ASTLPRRSGWLASTPESITATAMPSPCEYPCAAATLRKPRCHCFSRTASARAGTGCTASVAATQSAATTPGLANLTEPARWRVRGRGDGVAPVAAPRAPHLPPSPTGCPDPSAAALLPLPAADPNGQPA